MVIKEINQTSIFIIQDCNIQRTGWKFFWFSTSRAGEYYGVINASWLDTWSNSHFIQSFECIRCTMFIRYSTQSSLHFHPVWMTSINLPPHSAWVDCSCFSSYLEQYNKCNSDVSRALIKDLGALSERATPFQLFSCPSYSFIFFHSYNISFMSPPSCYKVFFT